MAAESLDAAQANSPNALVLAGALPVTIGNIISEALIVGAD